MSPDKSDRNTLTKEPSCGSCTFFGKLALCPRRERYAGATPCRLYERKTILREAGSPMFPLLPDSGAQKLEEEEAPLGASSAWYLVPFFFGILGGIVGYVAVKDRDEDMAARLLWFGIIMTFLPFILYIVAVSVFLNAL